MKRYMKWFIPACLLLLAQAVQASEIQQYLADMAGENEAKRVEARQGLRRAGCEAAPGLVTLLSDEREIVWRGAFNTLADIANETAAPGREAERLVVADAVMALLAPENSYTLKERGLRLAAVAVPPGYNVGRIAAFMNDKDLAIKARDALQIINSKESRQVLYNHLGRGKEDMDLAIIDSLDRMANPESVSVLAAQLESRSDAVRAAAMGALAKTGDPAMRVAFQRARKGIGNDALAFRACDAYLKLADAIIAKGGNWETAMAMYQEVLSGEKDPVVIGAAMSGLGRNGDSRSVGVILARLHQLGNPDLEAQAAMALGFMKGRESYRAILAAYPDQSPSMKYSLLRGFGRNGDALFADVLAAEAASDDANLREAATIALCDAGLPQGVPMAIAALEAAGDDEDARKLPIKRLRALAESLRAKNDGENAGTAYAALYRLAGEDTYLRQYALDGVKQFPTPGAIEAIMAEFSVEQMEGLPAETLVNFALALEKAGRTEEAAKVWGQIEGVMGNPAVAQTFISLAGQYGIDAAGVAQRLGVLSTWYLAGPFPWLATDGFNANPVNAPDVDLGATYGEGDGAVTWQKQTSGDAAGMVNLMGILGEHSNAMAFAVTKITVDADMDAVLSMGSDDGIKAWVNGEVVHENNVDRGFAIDSDKAAIKLKAGENVIVLEITQGGGGWNFGARLMTPDGAAVPFTLVD